MKDSKDSKEFRGSFENRDVVTAVVVTGGISVVGAIAVVAAGAGARMVGGVVMGAVLGVIVWVVARVVVRWWKQ